MNTHDELEQLSAYLDGELEPPEIARLEAHLPACAECSATLAALRAVVADLAALEQPVPSAQDSWALRSSIAAARRAPRRGVQAVAAAASAAAVLAAVLVATTGPPDRSAGPLAEGGGVALDAAAPGFPVTDSNTDYTEDATASLMAAAKTSSRMSLQEGEVAGAPAMEDASGYSAGIAACEETSIPARDEMTPVRFEAARYEGSPAYLLLYSAPAQDPDRLELWVIARADCSVLYWRQEVL